MKWNSLIILLIAVTRTLASDWVFDAGAGAGIGTISNPSFNSDISFVQYHLSASGFYRLWNNFFLGAETRFDIIEQTTDLAEAGTNIRGTIWIPIAPTFVYSFKPFALRFSYQFLGKYKLSNPNYDGQDVIWKKPSGFRLGFLITELLPFGSYEIFYQRREFAEQQIGESELSSEFSQPPEHTSYGIEYKFIF